ncbi:MAG TPA: O-antigen ligase family protein [Blastocatellia bacterium]|nr:O-antigen ligase family protein [Blastocatellia bacterium]
MSHLVILLCLVSLALLPWCWFPPFPWLHQHAQWSDAVFALTALLWAVERYRSRQPLRLRWIHAALILYLAAAALSLLAAPDRASGALKLLGLAELCTLLVITSDLAARPNVSHLIVLVTVVTSLLTVAAALVGLGLFYAGVPTRLTGHYGDLTASRWYVRLQAGTYNPNLLANYCIFASAVVARADARLPGRLRRITQAALWVTVLLTFSRSILAFSVAAAIRAAATRRQRVLAGIYAAVIISVIAGLTFWNLKLDPTRPWQARFDTATPSSRWQNVTTSLRTLIAHPLTGSGLGTSPGRYRGQTMDAHLTPVNIAATMGLPALAAFAWLIILLWRGRKRPTDVAVWSGLAGMALDAMASDIEDFRHLWVLFGLADEKTISRKNEER